MTSRAITIALLLFPALSSLASAQSTILALHAHKDQAALVSVSTKISGSIEHEVNGKTKKDTLKIARQLEFIDVVDKLSSDDQGRTGIEARRRFLRYEIDENGEKIDPPVAGATLKLIVREDGQIEIKPERDRMLPPESHNAEGRRVPSAGLSLGTGIKLPESSAVTVDMRALAPILVAEPELVDKASGEFSILSRDDEKGRMEISGPVVFEHSRRRGTEDVGWKWDLEVVLTIDVARNRIIGGRATGTVVGSGSDRSGHLSFEGTVSSEIKVDIDPKVEKEMDRKVKLREVDYAAGDSGVSFQLPSSFFYYELNPERGYIFISGENGPSSQRGLSVKFERKGDSSAAVDEMMAKYRGQPAIETEKVSVKGGKGFSALGKTADRKMFIFEEIYATKDGNLKLFYSFPIGEAKDGIAEMKRIRKSIKIDR